MQGWSPAPITRREDVGPEQFLVALSVAPHLVEAFHAPGQYHRVSVPGAGEAIFAIASTPGTGPFEYLVKRGSPVADAWGRLPVGEAVRVSLPEGPGFPLPLARGRPLLLVATGTGVAPLRSVLGAVVAERRHFGPVHLLYGARSPAHLAFRGEFAVWASMGIVVTPTVTAPAPGWTGAVGRVQQHLAALPVEDAVAFVCGQREMVREVRAALAARGLPPERLFLNTP